MKRIIAFGFAALVAATGCRKIVEDGETVIITQPGTGGTETSGKTVILKGKISKDTTLRAIDNNYLEGLVYVTNGATITIEAGATVSGQLNPAGGLVITRGAKINATGTAAKPIVFTSAAAASPHAGDWAGIVILGKASTNASYNGQAGLGEIEGGVNDSEGNGLYGAGDKNVPVADDTDSSGILQYVRIEYAGSAFLPDKEINSLTLGGVGSKTKIDHIQVSYAKDDAYEFFGGTVSPSYIIAYRTQDDDFDTDNGFSGKVQFGLVIRDSSVADASKSEAMESDNDANGSSLMPKTSAVFSNLTLIGPKATISNKGNTNYLGAVQIRRNSSISIYNSVILGWATGVWVDGSKGTPTDLNINDSTLRIRNTIIAGCDAAIRYAASASSPTGATDATITAWFTNPYFGNKIFASVDDAKFVSPFNYTTPDFGPFGTSDAAKGASFTDAKLAGFKAVTFLGAIAPAGEDAAWWKGWTRF